MSTIKVSILHIYNQQINFVNHVKMPNNIYIYIYIYIYKQDVYLFKSYTSVSFKPPKTQ